jgi:AraC family transcriptional regulator of arabinose operon
MQQPIEGPMTKISLESPAFAKTFAGRVSFAYYLEYHDGYELQLIHRGQGAYFVRDGQYPFTKNDLIIIQPLDVHRLACPPGSFCEKMTFFLHPTVLRGRPYLAKLFADLPPKISMSDDEAVRTEMLLASVYREVSEKREHWREIVLSALEVLAYMATRLSVQNQAPHPYHPGVRRVIEHINRHFADDLPLKLLADIAGLSPTYLSRLFSRCAGIHLSEYIHQIRITQAKTLLYQSQMKVADIALAVGFNEFADFNRNFKRITGVTPTSYRKMSHLAST